MTSKTIRKGWMLLCAAFITFHASLLTSCSESDDEPYNDYENWEVRNNAFFSSLEDSLKKAPAVWRKYKTFSKDTSLTTGSNTDCIYMKQVLTGYEKATEKETPMYNDSVRISYLGRLIPSNNEPEGFVFDSTIYNTYDLRTNATVKFKVSRLVDGFSTALIHMHRFETWRIYIPWSLGYGATAQSNIPAFSTLIFDVTLYDFAAEGHALPSLVSLN